MTTLRDARVLVTGGAGLIGSTITDLLVDDEGVAEVVVLDDFTRGTPQNLEHAMASDRVTVIKGDIRDRVHRGGRDGRHRRPVPPGRHPHHPVRREPSTCS